MTRLSSIAFRLISFAMLLAGFAMMLHRDAFAASLQANVIVEGAQVRLADVATGDLGDADAGQVVIAMAPAPGDRAVLSVQSILNIAFRHGATLDNPSGLSRIYVQRAGIPVPQEVIETRLLDALKGLGFDGKYRLTMQGRAVSFNVPVGTNPDVRVDGFQFDPRSGRFQAHISPAVNSEGLAPEMVYGQAMAIIEVPVLAQRMTRTDVIGESDVVWVSMPASRVTDGLATDIADLVGMSPRRTLTADQPIRLRDLQEPIMVAKNALVNMLVEVPGLTLTTVGRALDDGSMGSLIRVINTDTHQTVTARVSGPNRVEANIARTFVTADLAR
jgi:flagella basal body P-ring formation protein FlgA